MASACNFTGGTASSIKAQLPDFEAYHVNGEMRTARREKEMRAFREADHAIMSNARCLTEGVDVPAVDVVAFLSPRKSKVDIVQATGRAMRMAPGKERGYVLLPLFLETHENESLEVAVKRTDFEEAWDVLQAMQEQDGVLADIIREMREEKGRLGGFDDSRLRERVEVLGPEVALQALRDAVSTALVERLGITWDERYGELKRYRERFGHCVVPDSWREDPQMARWVNKQRTLAKVGQLSAERTRRLDAIGFIWEPHSSAWEDMFAELRAYKEWHGHTNVSRWGDQSALGRWVSKQRAAKRSGRLASTRVRQLDELKFIWDMAEAYWETMIIELKSYRDVYGHCKVPAVHSDSPQLGKWVRTQRTQNKQGKLARERKERLDALGFEWDVRDSSWERMFAKFRQQAVEHRETSDLYKVLDPQLAQWVLSQRQRQNKGKMSANQKSRLDEVGFIWDARDYLWERMFAELMRFIERFGHSEVPARWVENRELASWVSHQRSLHKRGHLTGEQTQRLNGVGFVWGPQERFWADMLRALKLYIDIYGNCDVPKEWPENPQLGTWVSNQRNLRNRGKLSKHREQQLSSLGVTWLIRKPRSS